MVPLVSHYPWTKNSPVANILELFTLAIVSMYYNEYLWQSSWGLPPTQRIL